MSTPDAGNPRNESNDIKNGTPKKKKSSLLPRLAFTFTALAGVGLVAYEVKHSPYEEYKFTSVAKGESGTKLVTTAPPALSPRDILLGYANQQKEDNILLRKNFAVSAQKEWEQKSVFGIDLYPIFDEKIQAGLQLTDSNGMTLFQSNYPNEAFKNFDEIPEVWWKSLLFIENRELLDEHDDSKNIVIEWDRTLYAVAAQIGRKIGLPIHSPGGSGLATQNEKILHSPGARTEGMIDKARQMLTASVRYYGDKDAKNIVLKYTGIVPLASTAIDGEAFGFLAGMRIWYGRDMEQIKHVLNQKDEDLSVGDLILKAQVYREALSLVMSVKKPSFYFNGPRATPDHPDRELRRAIGHAELEKRIDIHLPLLVKAGIISESFAQIVKNERLQFVDQSSRQKLETPSPHKFVNTLRIKTQQMLEIPSLYDLDRRDLLVQTTQDGLLSKVTEDLLKNINDPVFAKANGLTGGRDLLDESGVQHVRAAITIYERLPNGHNVLVVQTDNLGSEPLNLNEGGKLELGSTAKFRWGMVNYEMIMDKLYTKYASYSPEALQDRLDHVSKEDALTRWALTYLLDPETNKSFDALLDASLERTYSGNPHETFSTGGGVLRVQNFDRKEDSWNCTVRKCFHHSVNASFIRIMRDIVKYTIYEEMGVDAAIYDDINDPMREEYLDKFSKAEGSIFLSRALVKQKGKSGDELDSFLASQIKRKTPGQMAALYLYLHENANLEDLEKFVRRESAPEEMAKFIAKNTPKKISVDKPFISPFMKLYTMYAPNVFERAATETKRANSDLNDRAYITKIHPLALWVAKYKAENPDTQFDDIVKAADTIQQDKGVSVFRETYSWLYKSTRMVAQNRSLRRIIEQEAFNKYLLPEAQKFGYPFDKVVPSFGTVLGSSGDTPASLAKLLGIVQNDGILKKPNTFVSIIRGKDTPYEKVATPIPDPGTRVMREEVARSLRQELQGVVEEGTGTRLKNLIKLDDGTIVPIGGKTGSGNNVVKSGAGRVMEVKNRTATWTFTIGDRFYGTTLLYVDGKPVTLPNPQDPEHPIVVKNPAAKAHFTSATAVITTKLLLSTPEFKAFLQRELGSPAPAQEATTTSRPVTPAPVKQQQVVPKPS